MENDLYEHKMMFFRPFKFNFVITAEKDLCSQKEHKKEIKHINRLKRELEEQMKKRKNEEETLYFNRIHKNKTKIRKKDFRSNNKIYKNGFKNNYR